MNKFVRFVCLSVTLLFAQVAISQVSVMGKVIASDKKPIEGASVTEKGTKNGVVTDRDGKYMIKVKSANAALNVSAINFGEQKIALNGRSTVDVTLQEETNQLNEVSVTAGRQPVRKLETTQAVDIISNKVLKSIKPESFAEAVTLTPGYLQITLKVEEVELYCVVFLMVTH